MECDEQEEHTLSAPAGPKSVGSDGGTARRRSNAKKFSREMRRRGRRRRRRRSNAKNFNREMRRRKEVKNFARQIRKKPRTTI